MNPQVFAAHHNDNEIWNSSSSGGVFSALSDYIISQGGIVYGAVYDRQNNVLHEPAYTSEECQRFRGSKYVQSCVLSNYKFIQNQLVGGGVKLSYFPALRARSLPSSSI